MTDKRLIALFHRQGFIYFYPAPPGDDLFFLNGIEAGFFVGFPVQPGAPTLPDWQIVKIDPMLKEQFVLGSDRLALERRCSLGNTFACFAQRPITPTIQRAARRIGLAPA